MFLKPQSQHDMLPCFLVQSLGAFLILPFLRWLPLEGHVSALAPFLTARLLALCAQ